MLLLRGDEADLVLPTGRRPRLCARTTVRRFVGEFYERVLGDADITSRLVVATHELLENAVRYSVDGQSGIRLGVHRQVGSVHVAIDTNKTPGGG